MYLLRIIDDYCIPEDCEIHRDRDGQCYVVLYQVFVPKPDGWEEEVSLGGWDETIETMIDIGGHVLPERGAEDAWKEMRSQMLEGPC